LQHNKTDADMLTSVTAWHGCQWWAEMFLKGLRAKMSTRETTSYCHAM